MSLTTCYRPSTVAAALDDKSGLFGFMAATTLQQIAHDRTLSRQLAMVGESPQWKDYLPLHTAAQAKRGKPEADEGTMIHEAVERIVTGGSLAGVPGDIAASARAVADALAAQGLTPVRSEQFVYVPSLPLPLAGTRDMLARDAAGTLRVVDVKTANTLGKHKFKGASWAVQLAIYAAGVPHPGPARRDRWGRPVLDPSLAEQGEYVSDAVGTIVEVVRGTEQVAVHHLDLVMGLEMARIACEVVGARKANPFLVVP